MRSGGRPRVSRAGERAGRGVVRSPPLLLGSWLSASALPCAPLPPPLPSLDHCQRPGLPRAHGSPEPNAGLRRHPSRAGSSWPLGAQRAQTERGVTWDVSFHSLVSRSLSTCMQEAAAAGPGGRWPRGRGGGGGKRAAAREGGRQLCSRLAVPSSMIVAGGWLGAGV